MRQKGQSTVEFGASAIVLFLLVFGLVDLGRVFYFDVGLQGATREGAREASWFDPGTGTNPFLYDTDGYTGTPCLDPNPNPGIKESVDCNLAKSGLPASVLQNPSATCPATVDGNTAFNPPYADSAYPTGVNAPSLYICYAFSPGTDISTPLTDNGMKGADVNVILVMNFGFASGLFQGVFGSSIHIVANTHMTVGGY
jgi:TadE-like protein